MACVADCQANPDLNVDDICTNKWIIIQGQNKQPHNIKNNRGLVFSYSAITFIFRALDVLNMRHLITCAIFLMCLGFKYISLFILVLVQEVVMNTNTN